MSLFRRHPPGSRRAREAGAPDARPDGESLRLPTLLVPDGFVVWEGPVARGDAVRALADRVVPAVPGVTASVVLRRLAERDALGSTHIGEGVDLPHARMDEVARSAFALGCARAGVSDADAPTEVVWLLLLPPGGGGLQTTAEVARACRDATFRDALRDAEDASAVRAALARWERAHESPPPWTS